MEILTFSCYLTKDSYIPNNIWKNAKTLIKEVKFLQFWFLYLGTKPSPADKTNYMLFRHGGLDVRLLSDSLLAK